MKVKFDTLYRAFLLVLLLTLAWSVWAAAQTNTNKVTVAVTNVPSALVEHVEHLQAPLTFKLDEVPWLRDHLLMGEPLWKYTASLIYILLAFYAAKLIDVITRVWLKRLAARTDRALDDLLLELLRGPIKVVVFVVLLNIGLNFFDWSPKAKQYLSRALIIIVAASLTYLAVKVVESLLLVRRRRHAQESERRFNDQLFSVVRITLDAFIIVVAVLVTAQNMDINITAAIASLSIGGLAVGLAAQDTLANLFGAVAVFVDKPFRVGDQVKLDGVEGQVELVGLRSTRIRTVEGYIVAVPNKTVGNATISNLSRHPGFRTVANLSLAQDLPVAKVKRALALLTEIYQRNPLTAKVSVSFNQFSGGKLNLQVIHLAKNVEYEKYQAGMQELNLEVKERFEQEGISFS